MSIRYYRRHVERNQLYLLAVVNSYIYTKDFIELVRVSKKKFDDNLGETIL